MPADKDLLQRKKETLLAELESIKSLLTDNNSDNIPVLKDAILEETAEDPLHESPMDSFPEAMEKTEDISAIQLAIEAHTANEAETNTPSDNHPHSSNSVLPGQRSLFNDAGNKIKKTPPTPSTHASLSKNPFLPPHVRERFKETDLTPKVTEEKPTTKEKTPPDIIINASYTERLIDQLVAHHLPKIEAELRTKLLAVVKLHNERLKK